MGLKLSLIFLVIMGVMAGGFYFYYKDSQKRLAILTENAAKLRRHDLEELSRAKPGLMEKKINNGTKRLLLELEAISGETRSNTTTK